MQNRICKIVQCSDACLLKRFYIMSKTAFVGLPCLFFFGLSYMLLLCSLLTLGGRPRGRFNRDSPFSGLMYTSVDEMVTYQKWIEIQGMQITSNVFCCCCCFFLFTHLKLEGKRTRGQIRCCQTLVNRCLESQTCQLNTREIYFW